MSALIRPASVCVEPAFARSLRAMALVTLMLTLFVPRVFGTAEHDHDSQSAASVEHCAACVLGHAPAESAPPVTVLPTPVAVGVAGPSSAFDAPAMAFSFAVPFACGPPA